MVMPLLFLLLQSSFSYKWTHIRIYPSSASESDLSECENETEFEEIRNLCNETSDYYGGPDKCKEIFDSRVKFTCVRDDNADVNELISKVDKSCEYLHIYIGLAKDVTIDFSKLPNKMNVEIEHKYDETAEFRLLNSMKLVPRMVLGQKNIFSHVKFNKKAKEGQTFGLKIKGNHGDKLSSLCVTADSLEIIESDLSTDVFVLYTGKYLSQTKFKVKAKQYNFPMLDNEGSGGEDTVDYFANVEFESLIFYDASCFLNDKMKKKLGLEGNFVSFKFGKSSYEYSSNYLEVHDVILPNDKTASIGLITGAQKLTLIGSNDSYIPDSIVFDFRFYIPEMSPLDSIDPGVYPDEEESAAKLLEECKIAITKSGNWTGLKKPKITIKTTNDKIILDTTDINDISETNIVNGDNNDNNDNNDPDKKKGLETKYIIIIVVCVVVVVAAVVGVVVFFVLKKKKVKNNSASP